MMIIGLFLLIFNPTKPHEFRMLPNTRLTEVPLTVLAGFRGSGIGGALLAYDGQSIIVVLVQFEQFAGERDVWSGTCDGTIGPTDRADDAIRHRTS